MLMLSLLMMSLPMSLPMSLVAAGGVVAVMLFDVMFRRSPPANVCVAALPISEPAPEYPPEEFPPREEPEKPDPFQLHTLAHDVALFSAATSHPRQTLDVLIAAGHMPQCAALGE